MAATKFQAIPIKVLEISPPDGLQLCLNEHINEWENCLIRVRVLTDAQLRN